MTPSLSVPGTSCDRTYSPTYPPMLVFAVGQLCRRCAQYLPWARTRTLVGINAVCLPHGPHAICQPIPTLSLKLQYISGVQTRI